ncbi:MAG: ATP-binding cassette domain-containing protein [Kiritimatiellia bacterium]
MAVLPQPPELAPDVLVSVRNLSKKFCRNLRRSMVYGIRDLARNAVGRPSPARTCARTNSGRSRMISLELKRGDSLGLLGHNGSGKTTLLRLIAGIFLRTAATWCCAGGSGRSSPWARASIRT